MAFGVLFLILLFFFMPMTVLVILTIVVIANRASRKNQPVDHHEADSDSMAYQRSSRPPAQKTGVMPWLIVGMAFMVGLGIVALGLLGTRYEVHTAQAHLPQNTSSRGNVTAMQGDAEKIYEAFNNPNPSEPEPIDVPVEEPKATDQKAEDQKPEKQPAEKSVDDKAIAELDSQLEGSGASLILESILHAAMKSMQEDTPEEIAEKVNQMAGASGSDVPKVEADDVKKPVNAFQSLTKALLTELPENIDENTALKSLGSFLGRAIAVESVPRPRWVDQPTGVDPETNVYRSVVTVGPYQTRMECDRHLDEELRNTVNDYAELYFGKVARGRTDLSDDELHELIHRLHQESINTSVGPMVNLHIEMLFDNKAKTMLQEQFHDSLVQERITLSMAALGCVSFFLLVAFAVLKFDPLYQRRVKIAVVSVVILLGLSMLLIA